MPHPRYRRFSDASISEKILDTLFLLTVGIGYLFAMLHIYYSHQGRDGIRGLSVEDIRIAYYGTHQQTRLGAALDGPMGIYLRDPDDKITITKWLEKGSNEQVYAEKIAPIISKSCLMCHDGSRAPAVPNLNGYSEIIKYTETDTGASFQGLVRVSHIHLFGIAFLVIMIGRIFILCEMPVLWKRILVAIPFITILVDIFSWYLTKLNPGFAVVVILAGALMGLSIGVQIMISLYQLWFSKPQSTAEA